MDRAIVVFRNKLGNLMIPALKDLLILIRFPLISAVFNQDLVLDIDRSSYQQVISSPSSILFISFGWLDARLVSAAGHHFFNEDETEVALGLYELLCLVSSLAISSALHLGTCFRPKLVFINYLALDVFFLL